MKLNHWFMYFVPLFCWLCLFHSCTHLSFHHIESVWIIAICFTFERAASFNCVTGQFKVNQFITQTKNRITQAQLELCILNNCQYLKLKDATIHWLVPTDLPDWYQLVGCWVCQLNCAETWSPTWILILGRAGRCLTPAGSLHLHLMGKNEMKMRFFFSTFLNKTCMRSCWLDIHFIVRAPYIWVSRCRALISQRKAQV